MPTAQREEPAGVKRAEHRLAEFRERATGLTVDRGTSDSVLRPRAAGRAHPGQPGPGREAEEGRGQENRHPNAGGIREAPRGDRQARRTSEGGSQTRPVARPFRDASRRGHADRLAGGRFREGAVHRFGRGGRHEEQRNADRASVSDVAAVSGGDPARWGRYWTRANCPDRLKQVSDPVRLRGRRLTEVHASFATALLREQRD